MFSEYENLIEACNEHHNAVYDYIEKHGADDKLKVTLIGKYRWLQMVAEKNGFELE